MDIYSILNLNFIHFPVELLICEAVFLAKKPRREHFIPRMAGAMLITIALSGLWMNFIDYVSGESLIPYVFLYLGYAVITVLPLFISYDLSILETIFVIAGGYATQHMCYAFLRIFLYLTRQSLEVEGILRIFTQYFLYILWAWLIYLLLVKKNQDKDGFRSEDIRIAIFALVLAVAAVGLSVFYSYPQNAPVNIYTAVLCPAYGFLCCMLVLSMEYYVLRENRMKKEQEIMEQLLQMANAQQKSSKETIDIINIKCHDLKHQLKAFAKMEDRIDRTEYVKEVQQAVSIYDAIFHTGCEALDYILREKSLIFNEHQIAFSCMADGTLIDFMHPADIYTLMGNAMDNAIERVLQEKEEERSISLHIKKHRDMFLIRLENRCSIVPEFQDGLPVTGKKDKRYHGFGVKSIRYIAEKYHGEMFMNVREGKFILNVLLPENNQLS